MRSLVRTRIFRRQFFAFFGLALFFYGSVSLALTLETSQAMVDRQLEVLAAYRDQIAGHALDWILERRRDIRYLAIELEDKGLSALSSAVADERLSAFMQEADGMRSLVVVDAGGRIVASSAGTGLVGKSLADRDYVRAALHGRNFFSSVCASPLSGEPSFAVAEVLRLAGIDRGAVVGFLPLSELARIVESSSIEDFGRAVLVDARGRRASFGAGAEADDLPIVPEAMLKAGSVAAEYRLPGRGSMIGAYRWLAVPHLGLLVELPRGTALKQVHSLVDFMLVTAAVMLAVLVAVSYFLSSLLLRPIAALLEETEALRQGRIGGIVKAKTGTELDQLVELFNAMASAVREREERLKETAARDALTGLYNRGRLEEFLEHEIRRRKRSDEEVCFVMLDIDHFKAINDRYGHLAGDEVLRGIADLLSRSARGGDVAARYGGEEFAVILDAASDEEAAAFCERLRSLVEAARFEHAGQEISATVSLGWTRCPARGSENPDVIRLADRALYDAKNAGRNRVVGSSA
ncbi:MAG: GGDEF domain-containing protein [Treponema sp.]|nr:GGDEF domain-containing protein [Treponema sp.]